MLSTCQYLHSRHAYLYNLDILRETREFLEIAVTRRLLMEACHTYSRPIKHLCILYMRSRNLAIMQRRGCCITSTNVQTVPGGTMGVARLFTASYLRAPHHTTPKGPCQLLYHAPITKSYAYFHTFETVASKPMKLQCGAAGAMRTRSRRGRHFCKEWSACSRLHIDEPAGKLKASCSLSDASSSPHTYSRSTRNGRRMRTSPPHQEGSAAAAVVAY